MFAKFVGRRATALATTLAVVVGLAITPALTATAAEGDDPIVAEQGTSEVLPETEPPVDEPVVEESAAQAVDPVDEPVEALVEEQPAEDAPQSLMRSSAPEASFGYRDAPTILTDTIDPVVVGQALNQQLAADEWVLWLTWFPTTPGLSVSPEGVVGGTLDRAGVYNLSVLVIGMGGTDEKTFSVTVAPKVTTTTLANATVGHAYSQYVETTSKRRQAVSFEIDRTLPYGLTFNPNTGQIHSASVGVIPTNSETINFNVRSHVDNVASAWQPLSITVGYPQPVVSTSTLPTATVGTAYSATLNASPGAAITWTASNLPANLVLDPATGEITGTPAYNTGYGSSVTVPVTVTANNGSDSTPKVLSLKILTPAPVLDLADLPDATVGVSYNYQLTSKKVFGVVEYNLAGGTTLPAGLHMSQSGLIYGSPDYNSTAGASITVDFKVRVTGTAGGTTRAFSITVLTPAPTIETDVLATGWLKQPYSHTISTSGPGVILTVENLPASLTFDGTTISGKSLTAGTFSVKVTATNTAGSVTEWIPLTINDKPALTAKAPVTVETGTLYEFTPGVTGESVVVALGADAPAGMTIDQNGTIRWTPGTAGFYEYWVTATNPAGVATKRYTVRVLDRPLLTQGALDDGVLAMPYQQDLAHDGTDVRFTIIAGALPTGVALTQDGSLEGAPEEAGTFDFRVRAINGVGVDYDWFTLTILEPAMTLSAPSVIRGNTLTVSGSGYLPGDDLTLWLHSTPVLLGTVTATGGSFTSTVVIPANTEAGAHHLVVEGTHSGTQSVPLTVAAQPAPQSSTQSRSPQLTVTPADTTAEVTDAATDDEPAAAETEKAAEELPTLNKPVAEGETSAVVPANWAGLIMAAFVLLLAALLVWFLLWRRRQA